jgi:hypothetical protein
LGHVELIELRDEGVPILRQLSELSQPWSLSLQMQGGSPATLFAARAAAGCLASCSHLTGLQLEAPNVAEPDNGRVPWCHAVAGLAKLRELKLDLYRGRPGGLIKLTVLSSLCSLQLSACFGVDDYVAAGLLPHLVDLERLSLHCASMQTLAVLCAVSRLTKLTRFDLHGWPDGILLQNCHFQHLEPLRGLKELQITPVMRPTQNEDESLAVLRSQLPQLTKLEVGCGWTSDDVHLEV